MNILFEYDKNCNDYLVKKKPFNKHLYTFKIEILLS